MESYLEISCRAAPNPLRQFFGYRAGKLRRGWMSRCQSFHCLQPRHPSILLLRCNLRNGRQRRDRSGGASSHPRQISRKAFWIGSQVSTSSISTSSASFTPDCVSTTLSRMYSPATSLKGQHGLFAFKSCIDICGITHSMGPLSLLDLRRKSCCLQK
jgi:hypothetical protein